MNKLKKLSLTVTLFATLTACNNNAGKKQTAKQIDVTESQKEGEKAHWLGVYKGNLPCASCEEIQTTLVLDADGAYELRRTYVEKEIETFVEQGSYNWDEKTSEITLKEPNEVLLPRYKVEKGTLTLLNADGEKNVGELADKYVLKKVEIGDIAGNYVNGEKGKGYYDELTVTPLESGLYTVKISSGGSKKGCAFEAKGALKNNRILINLAEVNEYLNSKMVIEFTDNKAFIYSHEPQNNSDLMYFCGGGGSLFGDYTKE